MYIPKAAVVPKRVERVFTIGTLGHDRGRARGRTSTIYRAEKGFRRLLSSCIQNIRQLITPHLNLRAETKCFRNGTKLNFSVGRPASFENRVASANAD